MLHHHLSFDAQYVTCKACDLSLQRLDPHTCELRFDLLSTKRLGCLRGATNNVADACELVNLSLDGLTRHVQLVERLDDGLKREPVDLTLQTVLLSKHGPVVYWDQEVIVALLQQANNARLTLVIDASHLACLHK